MRVIGYGIDFGTSNSAISIAYEDRVEVYPIEPRGAMTEMLPSLVYLHRDKTKLAGTDAAETYGLTGMTRHRCRDCPLVTWVDGEPDTDCRNVSRDGGCSDSRLLAGLKYDLADIRVGQTHSWAVDFAIEDLLALVLRKLKREADRACGEDVKRVVLGRPVAFAPGSSSRPSDDYAAEDRLREAARRAGFEEIDLLEEPSAAALVEDATEGNLLVLDFGGGTFDVLAWSISADRYAAKGRPIGGQLIDRALFDAKFTDALGLDTTRVAQSGAEVAMPARWRTGFSSFAQLRHLIAETDFRNWLREGIMGPNRPAYLAMDALVNGGYGHEFYRAIEEAKIALSTETSSHVTIRHVDLDVDVEIDRHDLKEAFARYESEIEKCINEALTGAELTDEDLDAVLITGGSSQLLPFQEFVHARFGTDRVRSQDPFSAVVRGLGMEAQEKWR